VVPADRVGKAELADKPRAIDLQADPVAAICPQTVRVGSVGKAVRAIRLRAAPMAALPLPVVRVDQVDLAANAVRALREARVVRVELTAVDSDLQPGR
jgi:hypothetical protein